MIAKNRSAVPLLDLRAQYVSIREEIRAALDAVLASQQFILGPQVEALEQEIARYCGRRFGVGVASGTDALILSLRVRGVGPGDEVIVPTFSFIATGGAVHLLGARPVLVDIQPDTFNIDPNKIEASITPRTKAVIPVHLFGQPADMDPVLELAQQHNLRVIEDNAQSLGATYKGRKTASIGDLGCLSFYPSKNLGGYGDGGMMLTDSEEVAARLRFLRNHGFVKTYVCQEQGWNSRLDEIQAAILLVELRHLNHWKAQRQVIAPRYNELFSRMPRVKIPKVAGWAEHVYHQYTVGVPNRDRIQQHLSKCGIGSAVYYPVPMHLQPIFASLGYRRGNLPESERACEEVLSLRMFPELTAEQIERVVEAVRAGLPS